MSDMSKTKIKSVIDLSKYKIGQKLYWVVFRPVNEPVADIPDGEEWMTTVHPKVFFDRNLRNQSWTFKSKLPSLCATDFNNVIEILTSEPIVEAFVITNICRSTDTGEFYYANADDEWQPEKFLFKNQAAARKEKARIKSLFALWASRTSEDEV